MTTADRRGWGDPSVAGYSNNITKVTAGGISVRVHRDIAPIVTYLLTQLARHYNLKGYADDWGYAYRPIRGYETEWDRTHDLRYLSNHSWGLAVDLDSSINPMTSDLAAHHEFIRAVIDPILAPFHGRLLWGGEYTSPRLDYMHFEYGGTKAQAPADAQTAERLLRPNVTAHAAASPTVQGGPDMLIFHSPSHSYTRIPGWVKLDPKTLPLYKGVPVVEVTDTQFMQIARQETPK